MWTRFLSVLILGVLKTEAASNLTTFYNPIHLREYLTYSSLPLFEYTVVDDTEYVTWEFIARKDEDKDCPLIPVYVQMQYGGFPLFDSPKKYPNDGNTFYLERTSLFNVTVWPESNMTGVTHTITNPLIGMWFGVAYITLEEDTAVKKITDHDCTYTIHFDVTSLSMTLTPKDLATDVAQNQTLTPELASVTYRFRITHATWKYEVHIRDCKVNGTTQPTCPIELYSRASNQPTDKEDSHYRNCSTSKQCVLSINSPNVNQLHYLKLINLRTESLTFQLEVELKECGHHHAQWHQDPFHTDHFASNDSDSKSADLAMGSQSRLYSYQCLGIPVLNRVEDAQNDFYVTYSVGTSGQNLVAVPDSYPVVVAFDVLPLKDTGGTIRLAAEVSPFGSDILHFTIIICVLRGAIPVQESGSLLALHCREEDRLLLTNVSLTTERHFPYPEPGRWMIGFQLVPDSTPHNASETVEVLFSINSSPCVRSQCQNEGDCSRHHRGVFVFSSCDCHAGYRGYMCTDDTHVKAKSMQLFYSLFLTLSNLGFIPGIIVSVRRKFFVEALVYFANMFFSGFYHACDMHPWSLYVLCIMPYHVLSFCDFLCSILSFWVTLLAMAELPIAVTHFAHVMGSIGLAMGVKWQIYNFSTYLAPIVTGLVVVVASWTVKSIMSRSCYPGKRRALWMLPGVILAAVGLGVDVLMETDANYPITHSIWHLTISLSIVFLLPPQGYYYHWKLKGPAQAADGASTESDGSSSSEVLVLVPADSVNQAVEFDDDDVPLNTDHILLRDSRDDDDDEPLRDLL